MSNITITIEIPRVGDGNIPVETIQALKDRFKDLIDVTDTSFESKWVFDYSLIKFKGSLKEKP